MPHFFCLARTNSTFRTRARSGGCFDRRGLVMDQQEVVEEGMDYPSAWPGMEAGMCGFPFPALTPSRYDDKATITLHIDLSYLYAVEGIALICTRTRKRQRDATATFIPALVPGAVVGCELGRRRRLPKFSVQRAGTERTARCYVERRRFPQAHHACEHEKSTHPRSDDTSYYIGGGCSDVLMAYKLQVISAEINPPHMRSKFRHSTPLHHPTTLSSCGYLLRALCFPYLLI